MRGFLPHVCFVLAMAVCSTAALSVQPPQSPEKPAAEKPATEKPAIVITQKKSPLPKKAMPPGGNELESAPVNDIDEDLPLPEYPIGARISMGKSQSWEMGEEDTLLDVARHFDLGFVESRAANPDVDAWTPLPGTSVVVPSFRLLPRARQEGIVVNLAEMRMYYFRKPGVEPETFPIGIGKDGLMTPTGETHIVRKVAGPVWYPTDRMRKEKPFLPASIPAGPSNPLGTHAMYLGWPTFLIHGSNKPWAIGRRVSSGCMRMYPEDIVKLFNAVSPGIKVTVVEQPILIGWAEDKLYLEANPSRVQSNQIEIEGEFEPKDMSKALRKVILDAAGPAAKNEIDWRAAEKAVHERLGYPILIANLERKKPAPPAASSAPKKPVTQKKVKEKPVTLHYNYN